MKSLAILAILILIVSMAFSQTPDTLWTGLYNQSAYDYGYSIIQTTGGLVVAGITKDSYNGPADAYVVKLDADGDTLWTKTYGGPEDDEIRCIKETADGDIVMTGFTRSFGYGMSDVYAIKIDAGSGDTVWTKTYGGMFNDEGVFVSVTAENYFFAGKKGVPLWKGYIQKTDANGDTIWTKIYDQFSNCWSVQQLPDGYLLILSVAGGSPALSKADSLGNIIWTHIYSFINSTVEYSAAPFLDGYYIIGQCVSNNNSNVICLRTDVTGDTLWTKVYDSGGYDNGAGGLLTDDNGCIIVGTSETEKMYDLHLFRIDAQGAIVWEEFIGGESYDSGYDITGCPAGGGFVVAGTSCSWSDDNVYDFWVLRFCDETGVSSLFNIPPAGFELPPVHPNPFNSTVEISFTLAEAANVVLKVYDITGREVVRLADGFYSAGEHFVVFDGTGLSSGIYFYSITAGEYSAVKKMMLVK